MTCLFTLIFHGHVPMSPLIPYNIKAVGHRFIECTTLKEHIPDTGQGLTVLNCLPHEEHTLVL